MKTEAYEHLIKKITESALPLDGKIDQYDALLEKIGNSRFVLIGEATHGTKEFYQTRIELTQQLIQKKGFMAVAIEGDWPDVYNIHRYLQGMGDKNNPELALSDFKRFPTWMWRNTTIPPFIKWLRNYNDERIPNEKIGFYGLDLYSFHSSMQAVIHYLEKVDLDSAAKARLRYDCFNHIKPDPEKYGYLTSIGIKRSCEKEVVSQLLELQCKAFEHLKNDGIAKEDEYFYATQNARVVKNGEKYYRSMFESHDLSWNIRDQHMAETLNVLDDHLSKRFGKPAKIIVWAHNSHVGDARATELGEMGELNIGQLTREQHDADAYLIGFSTYQGTVSAASNWRQPVETKKINPGLEGSCEDVFHQIKFKNFLLDLHADEKLAHYLSIPRLQRAIGVVYRSDSERTSHYFFTRLPYQFDCIIHFDETSAVQPLERHD